MRALTAGLGALRNFQPEARVGKLGLEGRRVCGLMGSRGHHAVATDSALSSGKRSGLADEEDQLVVTRDGLEFGINR